MRGEVMDGCFEDLAVNRYVVDAAAQLPASDITSFTHPHASIINYPLRHPTLLTRAMLISTRCDKRVSRR
jgi:hypothetical protein